MDGVKAFLNSGAGKELRDYLLARLEELKDIGSIKEIDTPTHLVLEVKSQKKAYIKLREILSEVITLSEPVKLKDERDSFDIL